MSMKKKGPAGTPSGKIITRRRLPPPQNAVVRLDDTGYFSRRHPWKRVPIGLATKLTHKEANKLRNHLAGLNWYTSATVEKI